MNPTPIKEDEPSAAIEMPESLKKKLEHEPCPHLILWQELAPLLAQKDALLAEAVRVLERAQNMFYVKIKHEERQRDNEALSEFGEGYLHGLVEYYSGIKRVTEEFLAKMKEMGGLGSEDS